MSKFLQGSIPAWRIIFWGTLTGIGIAWFATIYSWNQVIPAAVFGAVCIGGLGFALKWATTNPWIREHIRWLIGFYVMGNLILLIWKLMETK
jgi:hypothetical protein